MTKRPYILYTHTHLYLYIYVLCCASSLSHVPLFSSPWTVATQASLSMGILQTRILEWVTIPSSRASSQPRDQTQVSFIAAELITTEGKPREIIENQPANVGGVMDVGLIPGLGRCPGGGHGNPLQYSCLENPMDRGAWRATVHRITKSRTQLKRLGMHSHS